MAESNVERRKRLTMQGTSAAKPLSRGFQRQQKREADRRIHNLICAYIGQPLFVAASNSVAALVSWLT